MEKRNTSIDDWGEWMVVPLTHTEWRWMLVKEGG